MQITAHDSKTILTPCTLKGHEYQIDPYIGCAHLCHYCYALNDAKTDWAKEIMVHADLEGVLSEELKGLSPQSVYMGWKTDPYQPCEAELRQTRKTLEMLAARGLSASILTKSDLILRDLDILQTMESASVSFSLAFEDDSVRDLFEGGTMSTEARMHALRECKKAGLRTSAMICPVIPYITSPLPLIESVKDSVDKVWVYGLSILNESDLNWQNTSRIIQKNYPQQYETVKAAVFDREHHYWAQLRKKLSAYSTCDFEFSIHF
ncbi:radical SAM protein [Pseudodesulfovibrio sp. zrk46]|uniref:SPL family radical SAM protein n=1 Tax=Pseudodesulfovibrio sp. zrk46 TaxID=2725288 RepID=UPI001448A982|nr:radical SAM protein [Pseudodesulfovibrio sp. zrk46]QJB56834.1 radical SAM protein [Pseudodesulfovibrio sp. zrk46]